MSPLEEDLERIDQGTFKLQKEWDRFFSGQEKKAPFEATQRMERLVRRYIGTEIRNNADRFRFQSMAARFNTLSDMWNRRLRAIEEGRTVLPAHLRHARGIAEAAPPIVPPAPPPEVPSKRATGQRTRPNIPRPGIRLSTVREDDAGVRQLYDRFREARATVGEPVVSFDSFRTFIAQERVRLLETRDAQAVDFRVAVKDGKVALKAKPVRVE